MVEFAPEKFNGWGEWAAEGLIGVSWSDVEMEAIRRGYDGMSTAELQSCFIDACVDKVDQASDYDKMAARLFSSDLRKRVYGSSTPPNFVEYAQDMIERGKWEDCGYSVSQLETLARTIDHSRDDLFPYSGIRQMGDKYLLRNKTTNELFETPQMLYMGLSMSAMRGAPIIDVIDFYHAMSLHKVNVPSPPLIGCRTQGKGFASCCLISGGDDADSIEAAGHVVYQMVKNRAGIGIELETRGPREPVKNGAVQHNGKLKYYRKIFADTDANTQESRGGSATMQFTFFDPEIETLLRLRNPKTADEARLDTMDYSLAVNKFFWSQVTLEGKIALISPYYAPRAHKAFYGKDIKEFIKCYSEEVNEWKDKKVLVLKDGSKVSPVKFIDATEIAGIFAENRSDTARIYMHNIDETNRRSSFKCPVRQSNLCLEVTQPTAPYNHARDLDSTDGYDRNGKLITGEVSLCNLGGLVINRIDDDVEYERVSYLLAKFVDNIIEMQTYPLAHIEFTAKKRRNMGIGMINLANAMAEQGLSYESNAGRTYMHEQAERMSFFLHKASIKLAKERGRCEWFDKTTYADGELLIDNQNKFVAECHDAKLMYDWETEIRQPIAMYGTRFSVHEAYMPSESSSVTIGATNGVEPVRQKLIIKSSRQGNIPQLAPNWDELQYDYEFAFDIDTREYIKCMAVLQMFVGQSISTNLYYDLNKYDNREIPMSEILGDTMYATKIGIKTLYYLNLDVSIQKEECANCSV